MNICILPQKKASLVQFFWKRYCHILLIREMVSISVVLCSAFQSLNLQSTELDTAGVTEAPLLKESSSWKYRTSVHQHFENCILWNFREPLLKRVILLRWWKSQREVLCSLEDKIILDVSQTQNAKRYQLRVKSHFRCQRGPVMSYDEATEFLHSLLSYLNKGF